MLSTWMSAGVRGGITVFFGGAKSATSIGCDTVATGYKEYTLKGVFHRT